MSDLAPFVAAALRDPVVQELMEENTRLRQKLNEKSTLKITGRKGTPVYYEALVTKDGGLLMPELGKNSDWSVQMPIKRDASGGNELTLPWKTFEKGIEVRLGGIVLIAAGDFYFDDDCCLANDFRDYFCFTNGAQGPVRSFAGRLKPQNIAHRFEIPETKRKQPEFIIGQDFSNIQRFKNSGDGQTSTLEFLARSQDVVIDAVQLDQSLCRSLIYGDADDDERGDFMDTTTNSD